MFINVHRKNRNAYAQLMLHMLKRGVLEGPFTSKPQEGPLPTLPPYMVLNYNVTCIPICVVIFNIINRTKTTDKIFQVHILY